MPNLKDIRKRIRSVKNTQQITRAMKMVAAAKLRRAQVAALNQRPYGRTMAQVLSALATHADVSSHPLFAKSESKTAALVVVTSDRGLCGGFNTNLCKRAVARFAELAESGLEPKLYVIGKKGRDYFRRRDYPILTEQVDIFAKLAYDTAQDIANELMKNFLAGELGHVEIVYNEFLNVMAPRILAETLLPIPELPAAEATQGVDYEYEPDPASILDALLPWHVRTQIWRVLQESWAAELAARMTAMESATKNAGDMIEQLTLYMNKVRQASITTELLEVVAGAESLKN